MSPRSRYSPKPHPVATTTAVHQVSQRLSQKAPWALYNAQCIQSGVCKDDAADMMHGSTVVDIHCVTSHSLFQLYAGSSALAWSTQHTRAAAPRSGCASLWRWLRHALLWQRFQFLVHGCQVGLKLLLAIQEHLRRRNQPSLQHGLAKRTTPRSPASAPRPSHESGASLWPRRCAVSCGWPLGQHTVPPVHACPCCAQPP